MAAPEGNQFWKLRSKHGRDKLFETPELLWEAACEYFQWCDDNQFQQAEQRKGNIIIQKGADVGDLDLSPTVDLPKMRPYTLHGLCLYLGCGTAYFRNFKPPNEDFQSIVTRIEETIYNQKFSGAASGFLNPNIIARDLGLRDSKDIEHKLPEDQIFQIGGQTIKF